MRAAHLQVLEGFGALSNGGFGVQKIQKMSYHDESSSRVVDSNWIVLQNLSDFCGCLDFPMSSPPRDSKDTFVNFFKQTL